MLYDSQRLSSLVRFLLSGAKALVDSHHSVSHMTIQQIFMYLIVFSVTLMSEKCKFLRFRNYAELVYITQWQY